ncbi:hypothetical protein [Citrobacter amalonaticus]|uniref:hypothetical protein n=1 Tax=Citrobacter amalonaticus TaxID=35703 RepID=UPI0028C03AFE|nr:hypothetical protein [Citrobacter amalonaticus]MDT7071151.1 hypothetical protein [Citrobacter amalonaticus]
MDQMKVKIETALNCLDRLKKLNDLLVVIAKSMREENSTTEEIETCVGIAWDIGNSLFETIDSEVKKSGDSK